MSKLLVPSPPLPAGAKKNENLGETPAVKSKAESPLDTAFLGRVYRSMFWVGILTAVLAAFGLREAAAVSSLVAGVLLAATLLRAQEISVRALMQPKEKLGGMDAKLFLVLLLPIKFIGIVAVMATLNYFKLIAPAYVAAGFFVGQLVLIAKVGGWMMTRAAKK